MTKIELTCTKVIRVQDVPGWDGKPRHYHVKCGRAASECEIQGHLTTAKAILCGLHKYQAERQAAKALKPAPFAKSKMEKRERAGQQRLIP